MRIDEYKVFEKIGFSALKCACLFILGFFFSIKIFFNQEESILIRPLSGEMEETDEICTRLRAVTPGCPVRIKSNEFKICLFIISLKKSTHPLLECHMQRKQCIWFIYNVSMCSSLFK